MNSSKLISHDRFGFAKFVEQRDSEACIRGFYRLGYEVGFARVTATQTQPLTINSVPGGASDSPSIPFSHQYSQLAGSSAEPSASTALQLHGSSSSEPSGSPAFKSHGSSSDPFLGDPSMGNEVDLQGLGVKIIKFCGCRCFTHDPKFTDFDPRDQESFNSRLKAEGDEGSTNLYISNLPKSITENELAAIFMEFTILSSKILRDSLGNSRGVGFAR